MVGDEVQIRFFFTLCININLKQTYFWEPCISSYQHQAHKENKDYMIYNNLGA